MRLRDFLPLLRQQPWRERRKGGRAAKRQDDDLVHGHINAPPPAACDAIPRKSADPDRGLPIRSCVGCRAGTKDRPGGVRRDEDKHCAGERQRLAYVQLGSPVGKAVVLIHGYTDNARDWVPLAPYLSRDLRLILIDIRGHGQSSKP